MNYGTVELNTEKKAWQIDCQPHVAIRLKRHFAKIDKKRHDRFLLSDTTENCRDLLWFMDRYPMEVKTGAEWLRRQADDYKQSTALIEALLSRQREAPAFPLALPPREYQRIAAAIVLENKGLLLADDVGLGKTVSAIAAISDPSMLPALVVTLTHLPPQWMSELNRFAPHLRVVTVKKATPYDLTQRVRRGQFSIPTQFPDVLIMNYHKLRGWAETIAPLVKSVIYDECQELRHAGSDKYAAAQHISTIVRTRMGLSATPIYNYGGEIYNVVNCLRPDALGTRQEFVDEWCEYSWQQGKESIKNPKAFGMYMRETGLMLRRTRADVGRELPELTKVPHHIDADEDEIEKISGSAGELARVILAQNEAHKGQKMNASEMLSNLLRQATGIAKAKYVAEFVRLLVENGEPVVLYGWHREVYSIWLQALADLNPVMYTGTESVTQKTAAKERFTKGESKVLVMSLRSGAGVDGLQGVCRTVVFGELDWSPGVHEQCIGRIHRDGQGDKVLAYFLVSTSGSDPVVSEALGLKKQQIDGIRNEQQDLIAKLQSDGGHIKRLAEMYLKKAPPQTEQQTLEASQ